jgi:Abnormal spindle-like microcephaly-assoc'd, ASPM-SPD-2-Hydin
MLNPLRSIGVFAVLSLSTFAASQAVVSLSPTSISFGNQQVGVGSAAQVVTLTNTGTTSLSTSSIKISSGNMGDFSETSNCPSSLAANASCTISVIFTPTKTGNRSSAVKITDNAAGSPQSVAISGVGVAPVATLSPASISFKGVLVGSTGTAVAITLSNTGTSSLTVTSVMATGDFYQVNNCTATPVAAGGSCTITVNFTPTAVWSRGGSIVITDNAYNNPQQVVFLVGMGNSGATAKVSGSSLTFGNQNLGTTSSVKTFTLTNSGTAALNINSIVASGDFSQTNDCPIALSTTAVCTVSVTFSPSYTGKRTGYVTINDTDPSFLQTVTVSGTGTLANALIKIEPDHAAISPIQTQQLTATVTGIPNPNIAWAVDGIAGGNTTVGTISSSGLYTPSTTPAMHIIQATNLDNTQQTAAAFMAVNNYAGTFTGRNDSMRTGQNLNEVALTTGNVNRTQFGKLFTYPVDGYVFAQPLYVPRVNIGGASHNVVYVATESDSVYAFDADNNLTGGGLLWQTSFINPTNNVTTVPQGEVENGNDIPVQVGITGTPVIDPTAGPNGTLFVVARTKEISNGVTSYVQRLHALDLTTGAEQSGSPVIVQATVSGSGAGSSGGQVAFDPLRENSRPALLLTNGTIYICWASLEDILPFHGWVIGYSETTLQQTTAFNTTPNGSEGGIWQGGDGAMADASGNVFVVTSNGTFDASTGGGIDYGDTVLKLTAPNGILSVGDYFSPFNQSTLSTLNWDLGGGGAMLLPDQSGPYPHVMFVGGKGSTIYELNRDFLGGFSATANQNLLTIPTVLGASLQGSGNRGGPAYWQSQVYYVGSAGYPMQFSMQGGLISTLPIVQSTKSFGYPGASPVVSANGNTNGILWALQTDRYFNSLPASLHAFDASNVSRQLYNSSDNATRDVAGPAVKFTAPTVANGKVYVGTQTEVDVYGLLP